MKQNPNSSNSIPDFAAKKGKILETLQQRKKPKLFKFQTRLCSKERKSQRQRKKNPRLDQNGDPNQNPPPTPLNPKAKPTVTVESQNQTHNGHQIQTPKLKSFF
jgi:hypothetical protein